MESFKKIEDYPVVKNPAFNPEELSAYNEYLESVLKETTKQDKKAMEWLYSHPVILD